MNPANPEAPVALGRRQFLAVLPACLCPTALFSLERSEHTHVSEQPSPIALSYLLGRDWIRADALPAGDPGFARTGAAIRIEQTSSFEEFPCSTTGGWQEHNNMQPYGVIAFAIATQGLFPSRN